MWNLFKKKTFKTKATLRRNLNLHNEYICGTCSQNHKATKHCDTYLCSICGKSFNRRFGLNAHNKLHLERVEAYTFEQCGKSFINKHQLADHLNDHTGNKPHTCGRCNGHMRHSQAIVIISQYACEG